MTAIEVMKKYYKKRDLAAKEWKKNGGKVVGYFCDNVPEELIMAAGFFPLRISGDPNSGMETVGEYQDKKGMSFFREPFVASMTHMIINGKYKYSKILE